MNINDDMPCFGGVPIDVRVSRGRLRCVPPYSDNELEFSSVEGELLDIARVRWHGWAYWCVRLRDEANTYNLLFFEKSAQFIHLVKCLVGRKVEHLKVTVGTLNDETYQMIVEGDYRRLEPANIDLPPIKCRRKSKRLNRKKTNDYSARLKAVEGLVNELYPTHVHT